LPDISLPHFRSGSSPVTRTALLALPFGSTCFARFFVFLNSKAVSRIDLLTCSRFFLFCYSKDDEW
jgi:hypothetical protein